MRKLSIIFAAAIVLILFVFAAIVSADQLQLAAEGQSSYVILIGPQAGKTERFAAEELQKYFEKITGAKLPVVTGCGESPFISVGNTSAADGCIVPSRYPGDDAYRIQTVDKNLILKGAHGRATLFAVYDLLERFGCWWFSPAAAYLQPFHEYVPHKPTLSVKPIDVFERPLMKYRRKESATCDRTPFLEFIDWMAKNRCNTLALGMKVYEDCSASFIEACRLRGIEIQTGGHTIAKSFLDHKKYYDEHPEWFGMVDGERQRPVGAYSKMMFETANPEAVATFTANLINFLKKNPEIKTFRLWAPDVGKWSESPESLALGGIEERTQLWVNEVAMGVREASLNTKITFIAYPLGGSLKPPEKMLYDKDIIMEFCPIQRDYSKDIYDTSSPSNIKYSNIEHNRYLLDWIARFSGEINSYTYYAKYSWLSLPVALHCRIADETKYMHKIGVVGAGIYGESTSWLPLEIHHLSFARACWDSCFDVDKWYTSYLKVRYGGAAEAMRRYLALASEVSFKGIIVQSRTGSPSDYLPMVEDAREQLALAGKFADTPMAKWIIKRIYWHPDYQVLKLKVLQARQDKKSEDEIKAIGREIKALIDAHANNGSVFSRYAKELATR